MASFNKVILAGNLTRDPELRYSPKGMAICKFGLAINRNWTNEAGEKKEEVTFVDIDAFGKQAEVISQYLRKGQQFLVEGRLRLDQWDDKQTGQKRSKLGVVLEGFSFIGTKPGDTAGVPSETPPSRPTPASATPVPPPAADDGPPPTEDDVPF
jgi:single-strand DNA-binding protein